MPSERRPLRRRRGRPRGSALLSRERILAAAVELLDAGGLAGLSMARLARLLGVTPMSLYNHFPRKAALLDGLHEAVLAGLRIPIRPGISWQAMLAALARGLRAALRAHPNAILLFATRPVRTPVLLDAVERALGVLRQAGFDRDEVVLVVDVVSVFTIGHALSQFGPGSAAPVERTGEDPGRSRHDYDREFELGLEVILAGLAIRLRARERGGPGY
jgi:AcrR family transcriptional regulator